MLDDSVAERYADSLFQVSEEAGKTDAWERQLAKIVRTVSDTPFLSEVMRYPFISAAEKREMIRKVFAPYSDQQVMNFLYVIIDRGRASYLGLISRRYSEIIMRSRGIVAAEITSACQLSPSEKARLNRVLSKREGCRVESVFKVDPSIIGGVVVRIGGRIIDGSLSRALSLMRGRFASVDVSGLDSAGPDKEN